MAENLIKDALWNEGQRIQITQQPHFLPSFPHTTPLVVPCHGTA